MGAYLNCILYFCIQGGRSERLKWTAEKRAQDAESSSQHGEGELAKNHFNSAAIAKERAWPLSTKGAKEEGRWMMEEGILKF